MLRAHSADGLSALAFELESWGLLVHTSYGFLKGLPFSAYGEAAMLFAQNALLLALIYKYARLPASRALAAIIVAVSAVAAVVTGEQYCLSWGGGGSTGRKGITAGALSQHVHCGSVSHLMEQSLANTAAAMKTCCLLLQTNDTSAHVAAYWAPACYV